MPKGKRADSRPEAAEPKQQPLIDVAPERQPEPQATPDPLPARDGSPDGSDRVSVKILDGKFDASSLRTKTAEKFQQAIKLSIADPEFRKWAGLEGVPSAVLEEAFKPEQFGILLDVVVNFECIFMTSKTALPPDVVSGILSWSPEEHKIIDEQGARIISRYLPGEWLSKADIFIFIITFLSVTAKKMHMVNKLAQEQLEAIGKARAVHAGPTSDEPGQSEAKAA